MFDSRNGLTFVGRPETSVSVDVDADALSSHVYYQTS